MSATAALPQSPEPSMLARVLGYLPLRRLLAYLPLYIRSKCAPLEYESLFPTRGTLKNMPVDIILLIARQLPPESRLVLSHACRTTYGALEPQLRSYVEKCGRTEYCAYLACVARDYADLWLCEGCAALHRVPSRGVLGCPGSMMPPCELTRFFSTVGHVHIMPQMDLFHCHIQIALKYTRLGESRTQRQQQLLDRLLAPAREKLAPEPGMAGHRTVAHWKSAFPKIVDGSYLIHLVQRYDVTGMGSTLSESYNALFGICPHERWYHSMARVRAYRRHPRNTRDSILRSVHLAMNLRHQKAGLREVSAACCFCDTDYSVELCPGTGRDYLTVKVWRNLGREDSPLSVPWVYSAEWRGPNRDPRPPVCESKQKRTGLPLSFRQAYEKGLSIEKM